MREFSVPPKTEVRPDEALTDMVAENAAEHGDEVGLRVRRDGQWHDVTWRARPSSPGSRTSAVFTALTHCG